MQLRVFEVKAVDAFREEVHHRFPANLAVGNNVDAREFVILDNRFHCVVVGFFNLVVCQNTLGSKVTDLIKPAWK
jgi:hypothetical protein